MGYTLSRELNMNPHRSTTHQERYYHFQDLPGQTKFKAATVFARKEEFTGWFLSIAFCAMGDSFQRRIGRQVARRRYFKGTNWFAGQEMNYEIAETFMKNEVNYNTILP